MEQIGGSTKDAPSVSLQNTGRHIIKSLMQKALEKTGVDVDAESNRIRRTFLNDKIVRVYIDDVDRGWSAADDDINNISALVNAARNLTNEDNRIQIRIGLRSDAYFLYRTSDESTDKIESNVVSLSWNRHDILTVMALRVATYLGNQIDPSLFERLSQKEIAREFHSIIDEKFTIGKGKWQNAPIHIVLLSLNRNRPRDLIKLLTEAEKKSYRREEGKISSASLESVFASYSNSRITDLTLEFKSEMSEVEKLLYNMAPSGKRKNLREQRWLYTNNLLF